MKGFETKMSKVPLLRLSRCIYLFHENRYNQVVKFNLKCWESRSQILKQPLHPAALVLNWYIRLSALNLVTLFTAP